MAAALASITLQSQQTHVSVDPIGSRMGSVIPGERDREFDFELGMLMLDG